MRRRWEDRAGLSASRRRARGNGRTQGKQGGGGSRANTPHIFSRWFLGLWGLELSLTRLCNPRGIGFRGLFLKNFIISDVATFRDFSYICAKRNSMNILCKSLWSPHHDIYDFQLISLNDTPADGYEPMSGGNWYVSVTEISQRWAPAMGASIVSHA